MTRPARCRWAVIGLPLLALAAGCQAVMAFLVPPPEAPPPRADSDDRGTPDLVVIAGTLRGVVGDQAVAVRDGRIVARGTADGVLQLVGPTTSVVREPNGVLLAGFVDAHVHLEGAALLADAIDLRDADADADVLQRVSAAVVANGYGGWVWGFGLRQPLWQRLSAIDLDRAARGARVYLSRADGHGAICSLALARAFPVPLAHEVTAAAGRIEERLAGRAWRELPAPRVERLKPLLLDVLHGLSRKGITEIHAMGAPEWLHNALATLELEGRLPVRTVLFLDGESTAGQRLLRGEVLSPALRGEAGNVRPYRSRLVHVAGVKFWLDGSLGGRTAALAQPYADAATAGTLHHADLQLAQWLAAADAQHIQVALHAIGDAAVAQIARVLAGMRRPADALPTRIEHAQVIDPTTLARLRGLAIVFSIQPLHAPADASFAAARLGAERMPWAYRATSLAAVAPVIAGSDLPVGPSDPLAMARNLAQVGLTPAQAGRAVGETVDVDMALRAVSGGTGLADPLTVGARADFVLWSRDPVLLLQGGEAVEPLLVVVDGRVTFRASR
ncbi:MAG: hypothetical protein EXR79_01220 [Myxococcales bacterium]|nr:hypothetical protein [Myxococcales bacterium]